MERYRFGRVVVKVGSNVLTRDDGTLDTTRMSALSDQIAQLHRGGVEIILVSSGAVAAGRSELGTERKLDSVSARQLFSAVGQVKLINRYYELMRDRGILCGQVLTTKESFSTRRHYLNQQHCMTVMLDHGVIPIVNENDTVSVTELMFTDNDELSGLIAAMMDAEALIILSNIDGIYNGDPSDPASAVIRTVEPHRDDLSGYIQTGRSQFGRGGMLTKYRMASKVADEGIEVTVANGKRDGILTDLLSPGSDVVSTRFVPASHSISQVKKWIAHSEGFAKGELHINEGAYEALLRPEATTALLEAVGQIDLVIPRGSKGLIDYVRDHARVPVIETGAGVCHTYFDREGDLEKGARIVFNAKTRRVSVCNALDCLIVHRERLADLPELCGPLAERQVVILADPPAYEALDGRYPGALLRHADEHSYGTEFLAYRMSIRTVGSLDEAVEHIARYSSRHSEAVVSENAGTIREFQQRVDAACVYANVSTAFTDGAQFGLGAEIGISTQKLHARGPMALRELTTYKYLIDGDGQTRA